MTCLNFGQKDRKELAEAYFAIKKEKPLWRVTNGVKKTQKTPKAILERARKRQKEINPNEDPN